jgi:hypothetical protein
MNIPKSDRERRIRTIIPGTDTGTSEKKDRDEAVKEVTKSRPDRYNEEKGKGNGR